MSIVPTNERRRSKSKPDVIKATTLYNGPAPLGAFTPYTTYIADQYGDVMYDNITPNWVERKRAGEIIVNDMQKTVLKVTSPSGERFMKRDSDGYLWCMRGGVTEYLSSVDGQAPVYKDPYTLPNVTRVRAEARQKALASIDKTNYQFLESAAELHKTIDFCTGLHTGILAQAREFNRAVVKKASKRNPKYGPGVLSIGSNIVGSCWLASRYAFRPMIMDIANAVEAYMRNPVKIGRRRIARGKSESYYEDTVDSYSSGNVRKYRKRQRVGLVCRSGIVYEYVVPPKPDLSYYLGFRLKDVPSTIWELMPYSWVVDWLLNVGDTCRGTLNLMDQNIHILGAWDKMEIEDSRKFQFVSETPAGGWSPVNINGNLIDYTMTDKRRTAWGPDLSDVFAVSPSDQVLNLERIGDLASLSVKFLTTFNHPRFR